jgi:2-polyprenyl-3-methyl-5-hydroxy-6-metoxy-1,4-benzoquinol methylase
MSYILKVLFEISQIVNKFRKFIWEHSIIAKIIFQRNSNVAEFWDLAHRANNRRWLTGSSPADELGFLKFTILSNVSKNILVVGVGQGKTANYLAEQGMNVEVLDITPSAFSGLNKNIVGRHLVTNYSTLPLNKFDFVLHHLVAQHMSNDDLMKQIENLLVSIRKDGEIRIQIASAIDHNENDLSDSLADQKKGSVLRSPGLFIQKLQNQHNISAIIENKI